MKDALRRIAETQDDDQFRTVADEVIAAELQAEPKMPMFATFALNIWATVKRQGATDVEALTMTYYTGLHHACEAMGVDANELADRLAAHLCTTQEPPHVH